MRFQQWISVSLRINLAVDFCWTNPNVRMDVDFPLASIEDSCHNWSTARREACHNQITGEPSLRVIRAFSQVCQGAPVAADSRRVPGMIEANADRNVYIQSRTSSLCRR